jgi:hypothetical protein
MFIYLCIMLSNTISASDDVRVFNIDKSGVTSGALTGNSNDRQYNGQRKGKSTTRKKKFHRKIRIIL